MEYVKIYIAVTLYVDERGTVRPLAVIYNGRKLSVDKVTDVRTAPPEHVGGLITKRYDCLIAGRIRPIFSEITGRWFVEAVRE